MSDPTPEPVTREPSPASHADLPAAGAPALCAAALARIAAAHASPRGSVLLLDRRTGRLRIEAVVGLPDHLLGTDASRPRSISEWVMRENRGLVLHGRVNDRRFEGLGERSPDSSLCAPLPGPGGPVGVLNLARPAAAGAFTEADLARLTAELPRLTAALERQTRLDDGLRAIADLEQDAERRTQPLLNQPPLELRHWEIAAAHRASPLRAGDLVARAAHPDGTHTLLVADVAGQGAAAAIAGAFVEGVFHAVAAPQRSATGIAAQVGSWAAERFGRRGPLALWVAQLGRNGQVASCGAGLPAPFLVPVDGSPVMRLQRTVPPAGVLDQPRYEEEVLRLLPGDTLVVLTDGVLCEADAAGVPFGADRAAETLAEHRTLPVDGLAAALTDAARRHTGRARPADDLLALALRYRTGG